MRGSLVSFSFSLFSRSSTRSRSSIPSLDFLPTTRRTPPLHAMTDPDYFTQREIRPVDLRRRTTGFSLMTDTSLNKDSCY